MKNKFEQDYRKLLKKVSEGYYLENRTGTATYALFDQNLKINLENGFPILTGKKIFFDKAYHEYIWFKEGMTTTNYLKQHDIHWWDKYADDKGELGKTYGYQLRNYNSEFDQLDYVIREIKMNSRRAHITLWNPSEINQVSLPVCYTGFTFVRIGQTLNMSMQFRSSDLFLGLPYDICLAALFLIEVASFCDLIPGELSLNLANAHIYENHTQQLQKYLDREIYDLPIYSYLSRNLIGYKSGGYIYAPLNN